MTSLEPAMTNHAEVGIEVALGIHERIPVERADMIYIYIQSSPGICHIEKGPTYDILKWIPIKITNLSRYMINYHNP